MESENEGAINLVSNLTIPHVNWQLISDLGFSSRVESATVDQRRRDEIRRMELRARRLELRAIRSRHGWRRGSRNVSTGLLFRTNHEAASRKSPAVDTEHLIARALSGEKKTEGSSPRYFDCNICLQVARDPILTSCGHLFCWPCLYRWIHDYSDGSNGCCFVCKGEVDETSVTPIYGRGISGGGDWDARERREMIDSTVPQRPRGRRIESVRQEMLSGGSVLSRRIEELMRLIRTREELVRWIRSRADLVGLGDRSSNSGQRSDSGPVHSLDRIDDWDARFGEMGVGESVDEAIRLIGGDGEHDLGPIAGHIGGLDAGFGEMAVQESGSDEEMLGIRADVAEDHLNSLPLVSGPRSYPRCLWPRIRAVDARELVGGQSLGSGNAVQLEREMLDRSSAGSDSIGSSSPPFRRRRRNEISSSSIVDGGVSHPLRRQMLA